MLPGYSTLLVLSLLVAGCLDLEPAARSEGESAGRDVPAAGGRAPDHGDLVRDIDATAREGNFDPDPEKEVRIIVTGVDEGGAKRAFAARIDYELQEYYGYYPTRWDPISSWSVDVAPDDFENGAFVYLLQHDAFKRVDNCIYRVQVHVTFVKTGYTYEAATRCFS